MVLREAREGEWLEKTEVQDPVPAAGEVLVAVEACGVCRTDLHIAEGDLRRTARTMIPGHEVVGRITGRGEGATRFSIGERVGIPWLHSTCGKCEYCLKGEENLCANKQFTGYSTWGGYAEKITAREDFIFRLPEDRKAHELAPLLCSGIIGYRALKLTAPFPGGRLAILGFGASAHLTLQAAVGLGLDVTVVSRGKGHALLATELGAGEVLNYSELKEGIAESAIVFAPAGDVVKAALKAVRPGGRVAVPAIHLDRLPEMSYEEHLFREKKLFSVEANTRADALEFLAIADRLKLRTVTEVRPRASANEALLDLKRGRVNGSAVLI